MDGVDLIQYLDSIGIPYKIRGAEISLQYCPYCEPFHNNAIPSGKGDYSHFYFNQQKQTFFCHKCGIKGNLYRFMLDRGDVAPITKAREISFIRPKENKVFASDTAKFYDWFQKDRGIKPEILEKYKVGFTKENGDTRIVYQYFDQKGVLFNRKYRTMDKKFATEKGAESNFYGLQFIDFGKPYLLVSEGEDDCHALVQMGFDNVVSVPYGAGNYSPSMDKIAQQFSDVLLLFDNDPPGQEGARNFAEKAGLFKCQNVILPFKDARECLMQGLTQADIVKEISAAEYFRHEEIIKAGDLRESYMNYISSEEKTIGQTIRIPEFNRIVGGIRPSEMTVLTGHTGKGKSTFAYNLVRWAEEVGLKLMIMSFENRNESVINKLIEIYTGQQVRVYDAQERRWKVSDRKWLEHEYDRLHYRDIYFLNKSKHVKDGYYDLDRMGQVIEYAVKFYGVNVFIVDHLHYFLKIGDVKNPVLKIDESVRQIKQWTEKYNIHIVLLVHPHMTQDDRKGNSQKLGLNCVKGASSISQEADNFWVIYRKETDDGQKLAKLEVLKNREMGRLGEILFRVADNLNTYSAC